MKELLKKNQKICLVPENIKGALSTTIKKVLKSSLEVEVKKADLKYYKENDVVEMFTVVEAGMLYFKPKVKEIKKDDNVIKVEFDREVYDLLQRREYTRVEYEKDIKITDRDKKSYGCKTIDIGAGGMKLISKEKLSNEKDYVLEFSLDSNIPIQCYFKPIRIDELKSKKSTQYVVSGRFLALKNIDKIAIVQFCFRKEMESTIK